MFKGYKEGPLEELEVHRFVQVGFFSLRSHSFDDARHVIPRVPIIHPRVTTHEPSSIQSTHRAFGCLMPRNMPRSTITQGTKYTTSTTSN